ncbi:MFS peptide transporter [Mytilinidion resinicola]|uniref:MFS peptide transporter n=1 Tax=Mytilinidion resinicola TaxID=574789 RepID=A0A6A6YGE9_9PEZI|nr:MFS peptide transporter [Mytilinidion resinicola]KAF2807669.1 MFS peptide transporter [Mytilinidion resinicola]
MPQPWRSPATRGAYTTVAQAEETDVELRPFRISSASDRTPEKPVDAFDGVGNGAEPTLHERDTLRRVSDKLPWSAFLVAVVEFCERFAYYGLSGPFQNYMANSWHDKNGLPGALGLNQSGATAMSNYFQFWCYLTPIIGAIIADQYLGKYLTIVYFSVVYMLGIIILFLTSLPISIENGYAFGGLITAMAVIGLGTGGIKANVSPLIAEQCQASKPFVRTLRGGERVIVDPAVTIQRIYMIFYMCINLGSLSAIATTSLEKSVGFWSAYLLPLITFMVGFAVLISGRKEYVVHPPKGGVVTNCFKALWIGIMNKGNLDAAKPSCQGQFRRSYTTPWDDRFVDELKRAVVACKVFTFYPIYWLVYNQMMNNFISQAGQTQLHNIPNDIMQNIDPLTILLFIPLLDRLLYPLLRRLSIPFPPISRITAGFLLASLAMLYAAFVQHLIYTSPPCYSRPSACDAAKLPAGGFRPNEVHVAVQTPAYLLVGLSEIFASVTGLEYAYTKAPRSMKSFIMAVFLLTSAGGSLLGVLLAPSARDPWVGWMYAGLAVVCVGTGAVFWWVFRGLNALEEGMNGLGEDAGMMGEERDEEEESFISEVDRERERAI